MDIEYPIVEVHETNPICKSISEIQTNTHTGGSLSMRMNTTNHEPNGIELNNFIYIDIFHFKLAARGSDIIPNNNNNWSSM